jgi:hypothetical protein
MDTTKQITKSLAQIAKGFESLARTIGHEGARHIVKHIHFNEAVSTIKNKISSYGGNGAGMPSPFKKTKRGRKPNVGGGDGLGIKKRKMSAAARKAIGDAQRKRWAKLKGK